MMATTHVLVGMMLATSVFVISPELGAIAMVAAILGGLFPDLDLYAGHRKTFHYPTYYSVFSVLSVSLAIIMPSGATVALAFFLISAAAHSRMDVLGGGLELKPWHGTSTRGVFNHATGQWVPPKRWIRYDGAPEDVVLAAFVAIPSLYVYGDPIQNVILGILGISALYAVFRKPLAWSAERLVSVLPKPVHAQLPKRFTKINDL